MLMFLMNANMGLEMIAYQVLLFYLSFPQVEENNLRNRSRHIWRS